MIPSEICLDANIFIAAMIKKEEHHEEAFKTLRIATENSSVFFEPFVVLSEVAGFFHRKRMAGELKPEEAEELTDSFFGIPLLLMWKGSMMQRAQKIAEVMASKRLHDSIYLAVAEKRKIPLITLDRELLKKGKKIYGEISTPQKFLQRYS